MKKDKKASELNRIIKINVPKIRAGVVPDKATNKEQYFQINLNQSDMSDNSSINDIHYIEWAHMQRKLNCLATNPRDNSYARKVEERKIILERNLDAYLSDPDHREKDFLSHLHFMLENYNNLITEGATTTVKEWISNRLALMSLIDKPKQNKGLDNQTKAYIIHFRVQMGDIQTDYLQKNHKVIKHGNYLEHESRNSYQEYRRIIIGDVRQDRIIDSCRAIITIKDLNPAIKNQAKKILRESNLNSV